MAVVENAEFVSSDIAARAARDVLFSEFANVLLTKPVSYRRVLEAACFARLKELHKTDGFFDLLLTKKPLTTEVIEENYAFLCGLRKETPVKKRRFLELLSELVSDRLLALVSRGLYTPLMDVEDVLRVIWDLDGEIDRKGEVVKVGGQ
jgi:Cdc6-like AAA superfamily ATPase